MSKLSQAFIALNHRNFRLFWFGQCVSLIGTWMQNIAQSWLVLELTHSGFWLGVVSAIQFLPMMLFSLFAGSLIDRFPKKRVILVCQFSFLILASAMAIDTFTGYVRLWHVLVFAGMLGMVNTLDMPARQAFLIELVGKEHLMNAIVLNSSIFNLARVIGPSVAGLVIASVGIDWCFLLNAVSFFPVIAGLLLIRIPSREYGAAPDEQPGMRLRSRLASAQAPLIQEQAKEPGNSIWADVKSGLGYVFATPGILVPILLLGIVNIFAMNFHVLVPLFAKNVFHGGADTFGVLMSANGVGALLGAVIQAGRSASGPKAHTLVMAAVGICTFELLLVPVRIFALAFGLLALVGFCVILFSTTTNSLVQVQTPDHLRGRVMSLYTMVFAGLTPVGSLIAGTTANLWGAPAAMAFGAVISLLGLVFLVSRFPHVLKHKE